MPFERSTNGTPRSQLRRTVIRKSSSSIGMTCRTGTLGRVKHGTTAGISYLYTARARYSTQRPGFLLDGGLWQCLRVRLLVPAAQMEIERSGELRVRLIRQTLGHAWIGNSMGYRSIRLTQIKRRSTRVLCIRGRAVSKVPLLDLRDRLVVRQNARRDSKSGLEFFLAGNQQQRKCFGRVHGRVAAEGQRFRARGSGTCGKAK